MRTRANREIQSQRHPVYRTEVPRLPLDVPLGARAPCSLGLEWALPWVVESGATVAAWESFPCFLSSTAFSLLPSGDGRWSPQLGPRPSWRLKLLWDHMAFSLEGHYVVDILLGLGPHVSGPRAPPTHPVIQPEEPVSQVREWPVTRINLVPRSRLF